jgi:hypothetical protein
VTRVDYKLIAVVEYGLWFATLGFALWRGDRTVRAAALAVLLPGLVAMAMPPAPAGPPWRMIAHAMEGLTLAGLIATAVRRPRTWLLFASAFQLALVATIVVHALDPHIEQLAFATANNTWWMLATVALLWGALDAHRARGRPAPARVD